MTANSDQLPQESVRTSGGFSLKIRSGLEQAYPDIFTPAVLEALGALAPFDEDRKELMRARIERRAARVRNRERIKFLDPESCIPRTKIRVQDARDGAFVGSEIPPDLRRQWIQGTGPGTKPHATVEQGIRNVEIGRAHV